MCGRRGSFAVKGNGGILGFVVGGTRLFRLLAHRATKG